jgi:hypothetical protein
VLNRNSLIGLASIAVIMAPSNVFAQTQPNIVIPTIEFSGDSTSFSFKVTVDATQAFVVGPVVISRDRFTLNGGTFNPLDLNLNLTPVALVNPLAQPLQERIGQSTIEATVGNRLISSKTLFGLASGKSTVDGASLTSRRDTANTRLSVGGDEPILMMP